MQDSWWEEEVNAHMKVKLWNAIKELDLFKKGRSCAVNTHLCTKNLVLGNLKNDIIFILPLYNIWYVL